MASATHIEDMPADLVHEPLNWLFAEHFRHRQLCQVLEELAMSTVYEDEPVEQVLDFLAHDLRLHVIDEEEDLFPLLRRRCTEEDDIERVLSALSVEHAADLDTADLLHARLLRVKAERKPPGLDPALRRAMEDFVLQERRHIALENAVVLPIARMRLQPEDLRALSRRLAARRGRVLEDEGV